MSDNMQATNDTDGTARGMPLAPPTSSQVPVNSDPNVAGGGGGHAGENNSAPAGIGATGCGEKRKRGRPRKYPTADVRPSAVTPTPTVPPGFAAAESGGQRPVSSAGKKTRGRPPGSVNKQNSAASGLPGAGFMPHVLDVKPGEDVLAKVMSFSENNTRAFVIMSASGAVSSVAIQQGAMAGGTVTYEGRFDILSLTGSFMASASGDQGSEPNGVKVTLSGPDGRVLGGTVAGLLTAASGVLLVIGSFVPATQKQPKAGGSTEGGQGNANADAGGDAAGGRSASEPSGEELGSPQGMASMPWR